MPFFSIIIPVKDKIESLDSSLDSVFRQSFKDFEVICVDDNSSDGSYELLEKYAADGKISLYRRSTPGPGGYEARNYGAVKSCSDWLVFFDADDQMKENHLEVFYKNIADHCGRQLYLNNYEKSVSGNVSVENALPSKVMSREDCLRAFSKNDFIHMNSACILRKKFISLGGFPEGKYKRGGDVYFWVKLLCSINEAYYDEHVTSSWIIDHSDITYNKGSLGTHPLVDFFKSEDVISFNLNEEDISLLKEIVNRKVLYWCVQKRQFDISAIDDVKKLFFTELSLQQWARVFLISFPVFNYYSFRHGKSNAKLWS